MNGSYNLQLLIDKMSGNMKFVGMFYIIMGGFYCLSIIGAIIGVPFIISGLRIRESASAFRSYSFNTNEYFLAEAIDKQNSFFNIQKIIMMVSLAFVILYIVLMLVIGITFFQELGQIEDFSV
ncbi:MAG TPA: DUF5362 domain-containing protein [Ignavibacteriaceae bacterium]|mgnify:CR=1 FL=1|nr:DUF5362 domain-containing protein [Ignavibacteriaceae bacterium]